jgi:tetratricopeptide (TPR) repeat protein
MPDVTDHMERLTGAGLLRLATTHPDLEYLFRHALVQDAAYASLLRGDRKRLHTLVGQTLELLYEAGQHDLAGVLAHHFQLAGATDQARYYFTQAADQALSIFSNAEAASHYTAALALTDRLADRAPLLLGGGEALRRQSRFPQALTMVREAVQACQAAGDYDRLARAHALGAYIAHSAGDIQASREWSQTGLAAVTGQPESAGTLTLLNIASRVAFFSGHREEAANLAARLRTLARGLNSRQQELEALITLGTVRSEGLALAQEWLTAAADEAAATGFRPLAGIGYLNLGVLLWEQGQFVAAQDRFTQSADQYRRCGYDFQEFHARMCRTLMALLQGDMRAGDQALPELRTLAARSQNQAETQWELALVEGTLAGGRGDYARAAAILYPLVDAAAQVENWVIMLIAGRHLTAFWLESGEWERATDLLTRLLPLTDRHIMFDAVWARTRLCEVAAATGDWPAARRWLAAARALGTTPASPVEVESLALATARLAVVEDLRADALAAYAAAAAVQAAMGAHRNRAVTLRLWAAAQAAGGTPADRAAACALLDEARALFGAMDLAHEVAATDATRARLGLAE